MLNFTFQVQEGKIFSFNQKVGKGWGRLIFSDGTIDFDVSFETRSQEVIDIIAANSGAEKSFKVFGGITQNNGYGDHKGKIYKNYTIIKIEVIN